MQKALPLFCALLLAVLCLLSACDNRASDNAANAAPARDNGVSDNAAPARAADYTNSIGMEFNNIPAGRFYMGSCYPSETNKKRKFMGLPAMGCPSGAGVDDDANDSETPQHEVRIRRGFRMGVYEVTLGQFKQYIAAAGRNNLLSDDFIKYNGNGDRAPVVYVSRQDAHRFIGWLNKKEGTQAYRLPSEAEWEYAARAGTTTRYSGIGRNQANCRDCGSRWDNKRPAPVGSFAANGFGLHDMHGNVSEWVADCWHKNYKGAPTDGSAWTSGCASNSAVVRGGAWGSYPRYLRSAGRGWNRPSNRGDACGFRLVQDLNP